MIELLDDFQRRTRALVSAVGLLQRSEPGSVGYAEFRRKTEKSARLVADTADQLLRGLAADAERDEALRRAQLQGVLSAEEAGRWRRYFEHLLPGGDAPYDEATLAHLRAFVLDARSLEASLRGK
jgi:hypothetical protein